MAKLLWDQFGDRVFETGIEKAVFYSPSHLVSGRPGGFAWNGFISSDISKEEESVDSIYFQGDKTFDFIRPGEVSLSVKAFTYPDEFMEFDGFSELAPGIIVDNQIRKTFGLSYKTLVGNDVFGTDFAYKLHIFYNLTSIPDPISNQSVGSNIDPIDFGWKFNTKPEVIPSHRKSSHIILDSRDINPTSLSLIEDILYGTEETDSRLPTLDDILELVTVTIIDNGDGTWTAEGPSHLVELLDADTFSITGAKVVFLDADTMLISSTYE